MEIRSARQDEVETILNHRVGMVTSMGWSNEQIQLTRDSTERYLSKGWPDSLHCYLAEVENQIIGGCAFVVFDILPSYLNASGKVAYVQNMYVEPSYRGKGLGLKLIQHIESECVRMGISLIWLHATSLGKSVYEKAGSSVMRAVVQASMLC